MTRWPFTLLAGIPLLTAALCGAAPGPDRAGPIGITLAYVAVTGHNLPLWVGGDEQVFERQGLNARILYLESSVVATAALLSGDVDIVQETPAASVRAQLKGADTIVLATHIPYSDQVLVGLPQIRSLGDLRHKIIGVTKAGTVSDVIVRIVLSRVGLVPGRDVQVTYFNTQPAQVAALQKGLVQAISVSPPNQLIAERVGAHEILDTVTLRIPYPIDGIVTTRRFMGAHPETVSAFLEAWVHAIRFIRDHPIRAQAVLGKYTHESDQAILRLAYQALINVMPDNPVPRAQEIQVALSLEPEGRGRNPADFFDPKPLEQAIRAVGRGP
jgi:NitT/TauT family transport system substrate-binding protein